MVVDDQFLLDDVRSVHLMNGELWRMTDYDRWRPALRTKHGRWRVILSWWRQIGTPDEWRIMTDYNSWRPVLQSKHVRWRQIGTVDKWRQVAGYRWRMTIVSMVDDRFWYITISSTIPWTMAINLGSVTHDWWLMSIDVDGCYQMNERMTKYFILK